jgi:hypothetical protein
MMKTQLNKAQLENLYLAQHLTTRQIATVVGACKATVSIYLRKFGIPRTKTRRAAPRIGRYQHKARKYWSVCVDGKTVAEHRLIAERTIGRKLRHDEVVHHRNGNPEDNRPENLEVMTQKEHYRRHLWLAQPGA